MDHPQIIENFTPKKLGVKTEMGRGGAGFGKFQVAETETEIFTQKRVVRYLLLDISYRYL